MKKLSPLRAPAPIDRRPQKGIRAFELTSERSGQALVVTSDGALDAYQLDNPQVNWPPDVRVPEGVLIGEVDGEDYVVFVELKGTDDPEKGKKGKVADAAEQLESMVAYFHPFERSGGTRRTGDDHHEAWASREDELEVIPRKEHKVVGLALYRRRTGSLPLPVLKKVGDRDVIIAHAPFHNARFGRLELSFADLLSHVR